MLFLAVLLLWYPGDNGLQINPLSINEHIEGFRLTCVKHSDCGDEANVTCVSSFCKCNTQYHVFSSSNLCLPVKQVGEDCVDDIQCQWLEKNATGERQFCICDSGSCLQSDSNGTLCALKIGNSTASTERFSVELKAVIIISVMSIMFIGICVALRMYSKARNWNARSIFHPLHSKLMNFKLDRKGKLSGAETDEPFIQEKEVPRHQSFSGNQSPLLVSKEPQTKSHECHGDGQ